MYTIEAYDRPSVAADAVVFGVDAAEAPSRKSLKQRTLKILLVRRGEEPFLGRYSLPGGFLRRGETVEAAAIRELQEEAGVCEPKILPLRVYSQPSRDPRGWILSCAFLALTRTVALSTAAGSDAADAHWLSFSYSDEGGSEQIVLSDGAEEIVLHYTDHIAEENALAFDHAQIIRDAFLKLRDEVEHHDLIFDLMPPLFAISDLQQPYEAILGKQTSPQNFRKRMSPKIRETEFYDEAAAHRISRLYARKPDEEKG